MKVYGAGHISSSFDGQRREWPFVIEWAGSISAPI
jgi:hypothetical protein